MLLMLLAQTTVPVSSDQIVIPKLVAYVAAALVGVTTLVPLLMTLWDRIFGLAKKVREDIESLKTKQSATDATAQVAKALSDTNGQRISNVSQAVTQTQLTVGRLQESMPPPELKVTMDAAPIREALKDIAATNPGAAPPPSPTNPS